MPSTNERYPILDESGKAAEWLAAGRGIAVWRSREIGNDRPDKLTPGDVTDAPHWAYVGGPDRILGPKDVLFYRKMGICYSVRRDDSAWESVRGLYSPSPAGWKAAHRNCPEPTYRDAPLGRFYSRFTVEYLSFHATERVASNADDGTTRPLASVSYYAIVEWTAHDPSFAPGEG